MRCKCLITVNVFVPITIIKRFVYVRCFFATFADNIIKVSEIKKSCAGPCRCLASFYIFQKLII